MYDAIARAVCESSLYHAHGDVEAMRIDGYNSEAREFYAIGEESGEEYVISYDEVDLKNDDFFRVLVDTELDGTDYC